MAQCDSCRKECSILFEDGTRNLCWLCSSREKARSMSATEKAIEKQYEDRRAWKRYPVQIHMKFYYGKSEKSKIIFPGTTVNLSQGGMCIEWAPCEQCNGYSPGSIHPECIFSRYDINRAEAERLYVTLFLAEDDVVNLTAQAVFVIKKEDGQEFVGLSFVELDDYTQSRVFEILEALADNGEA